MRGVTSSAIGVLLTKILGAGLAFVSQILFARIMGIHQYGVYAVIWTWLGILALSAEMGLGQTVVKYIAIYSERNQWAYMKGLIRKATSLVISTGIIVAIIAGIILWMLGSSVDDQFRSAFYVGLAAIPLLALLSIRCAILQGFKFAVLAQLPNDIVRVVATATIALFASWGLGVQLSATLMIAISISALLIAHVAGYSFQVAILPINVKQAVVTYETREWIKTAVPILFIAGTFSIMSSTDVIMLGALTGVENAAKYSVTARIITLISFGLAAVNMVVAPHIARLYSNRCLEEMRHLIKFSTRGVFAYTFLVVIMLLIAGQKLLILFGSEFVDGYSALLILLGGQLVNAFCGSVGVLMTMTGHQLEAAKVYITAAILNIFLNVLFIPPFGIEGAAAATALTTIFWNLVLLMRVRKKISVDPTILGSHPNI